MVAQQVGYAEHRVADHLQPAVAPDRLVLDAEVETVRAEMDEAEKRNRGEAGRAGDDHRGGARVGDRVGNGQRHDGRRRRDSKIAWSQIGFGDRPLVDAHERGGQQVR